MLFNVRLVIEVPVDNQTGFFTDGWCYDKTQLGDALAAGALWDGEGDPPGRWKKHVNTGRRGPGVAMHAEDVDR